MMMMSYMAMYTRRQAPATIPKPICPIFAPEWAGGGDAGETVVGGTVDGAGEDTAGTGTEGGMLLGEDTGTGESTGIGLGTGVGTGVGEGTTPQFAVYQLVH